MVGDDAVERMARAASQGIDLPTPWEQLSPRAQGDWRRAIRAALSALGPELRIVPVEPTEAMLEAGLDSRFHTRAVWEAMLSAAPSLPHEDGRDE